jgi:hypothetical protein
MPPAGNIAHRRQMRLKRLLGDWLLPVELQLLSGSHRTFSRSLVNRRAERRAGLAPWVSV